jgi:hypothetical protein
MRSGRVDLGTQLAPVSRNHGKSSDRGQARGLTDEEPVRGEREKQAAAATLAGAWVPGLYLLLFRHHSILHGRTRFGQIGAGHLWEVVARLCSVLAHVAFHTLVGTNGPLRTLLSTLAAYAHIAGYCQARFAPVARKATWAPRLTVGGLEIRPMPLYRLGWFVGHGFGTRRAAGARNAPPIPSVRP